MGPHRPYHGDMSQLPPNTSEPDIPSDQQPVQRVIGKRLTPPRGVPPSSAARGAMTLNARYRTRAPKGIFFYKSHDDMARDRERWTVDAIVAKHSERG